MITKIDGYNTGAGLFNLNEFISHINNYENFGEFDEVIKYFFRTNIFISYSDNSKNYIKYFLDTFKYKGVDFDNITTENLLEYLQADYEQERVRNEFTDGQIDIYYSDIYKSCDIFSEFINESVENFGNNNLSLDKLIQQGQYFAYDQLNNMIYNLLINYCEKNI